MEKINISEEIRDSKSLAGHLVLHGLTETLKDKEFDAFVKENIDEEGDCIVEISFNVNGKELPFMSFIREWDRQTDRMLKDEAKDIVNDKFSDIIGILYDLEDRVKPEIEKRLEEWELDE